MLKKSCLFVVTLLSIYSLNSHAFGVDVCFSKPHKTKVQIINCLDVDQKCRTSNLTKIQNLKCRVKSVIRGVSGLTGIRQIEGGRSLVHSDSIYFLAQLIGFSPWQAYQIMIYSEATDQAFYTAFDEQGHQILDDQTIEACQQNWGANMPTQCLITTPKLNGISKFNYSTGGMLLHLHASYSTDGKPTPIPAFPTSYLSDKNRPYEPLLDNFRAWTFDERVDACAAGITSNLETPKRTKALCEKTTHTLSSPLNLFSLGFTVLALPFSTHLGTFIIEERELNGVPNHVFANNDSFKNYISPHEIAFAKLGIFLHALADRYSHHMCTDHSYFYKQTDRNYTSRFSPGFCAQGNHFLWHIWEQGTNQSNENLAVEHQTMRPALEAVFDELIAFAQYEDIPVNPTLDKKQLIDELITVLQTFSPEERLHLMTALLQRHKLLPLPGHGQIADETIEVWLQKAGAPVSSHQNTNLKLKN